MNKLLLTLLATQALAAPFADPPINGSHGGSHGGGDMAGMSHGGGNGMSGMGGAAGMMGGMSDTLLQAEWTTPLMQMMVPMLPTMKQVKAVQNLPVTSKKPGAKRAQYVYGPLDIISKKERAKNPNKNIIVMDPAGTSFINKAEKFPGDITILNTNIRLQYEDGSPANVGNGIYNHHLVLADPAKTHPAPFACPGKEAKRALPISVMVATGEDNNNYIYSPELKTDFDGGYYVGKNDATFFTAEVVNYSDETKRVYAAVDVEYVPGPSKMMVTSETVDVNICNPKSVGLRPPPGQKKWSVSSEPLTVQQDGAIFAYRGHTHDGGVDMPLSVNGKQVCNSVAEYGGNGQQGEWAALSGMSTCPDVIDVKKGDKITISANFDFEKHPPREHAGGGEAEEMGIALFSFGTSEQIGKGAGKQSGGLLGGLGALLSPPKLGSGAKAPATV